MRPLPSSSSSRSQSTNRPIVVSPAEHQGSYHHRRWSGSNSYSIRSSSSSKSNRGGNGSFHNNRTIANNNNDPAAGTAAGGGAAAVNLSQESDNSSESYMNSSFEVHSYLSSKPKSSTSKQQQQKNKNMMMTMSSSSQQQQQYQSEDERPLHHNATLPAAASTSAVQFVPAYQEAIAPSSSTTPTTTTHPVVEPVTSFGSSNGSSSKSVRNSPNRWDGRRQNQGLVQQPVAVSCIDRMIVGKSGSTAAVGGGGGGGGYDDYGGGETSWDNAIAASSSSSSPPASALGSASATASPAAARNNRILEQKHGQPYNRGFNNTSSSRSAVNGGGGGGGGGASGNASMSAAGSARSAPVVISTPPPSHYRQNSSPSMVSTTNRHFVTPSPSASGTDHKRYLPETETDAIMATTSPPPTVKGGGRNGGGRIARLASLFSSRAVVGKNKNDTVTTHTNNRNNNNNSNSNSKDDGQSTGSGSYHSRGKAPSSVLGSESSSGYVGWPGTQDKRGATVVPHESSYEESDTGVGGGLVVNNSYQKQEQDEVDREVSRWLSHDGGFSQSFDSASTQQSKHGVVSSNGNINSSSSQSTGFIPGTKNRNILPLVRSSAAIGGGRRDVVEEDKVHRMSHHHPKSVPSPTSSQPRLLNSTIQSVDEVYGQYDVQDKDMSRFSDTMTEEDELNVITTTADPWSDAVSDLSAAYSKTSSAYFNPREVQAIRKGRANQVSGVRHNREAAASVLRRMTPSSPTTEPQPPTEEALALNNSLAPPVRTFNAANATGYRGLLHKTEDVPNLMDGVESDSTSAASSATSNRTSSQVGSTASGSANYFRRGRYPRQQKYPVQQTIPEDSSGMAMDPELAQGFESDSDIFDGLSNTGGGGGQGKYSNVDSDQNAQQPGRLGATSRAEMESISLAMLGGGLTTIQTTVNDFSNRRTASDFDETLSNSDVDQYGNYKIPDFKEMISAGKNHHDRSLSVQSLSFAKPAIPAKKQAVDLRISRSASSSSGPSSGASRSEGGSSWFSNPYSSNVWGHQAYNDLSQYYIHPDKMKTVVKKFRSISRAIFPRLQHEELEREEDATKAFALAEMRSRIMEVDIERGLERRGGTTAVDDIVLTSFNRAALRVRDAIIVAKAWRDGATPQDVMNTNLLTRRDQRYYIPRFQHTNRQGIPMYDWEEVAWVDDMDISQFRCHSIGPRHLRGSELFTIGDCQSILLKLCNERCNELRDELNHATALQIEAEDVMKSEGDTFDGVMTEAEMTYLASMEDVKTISHKLVLAEKAFALVKDRIEKLVAKYEALLIHFEAENDSVAPSSIFTCESSYVSDDYSFSTAEEREKEALARRAQRAELRAELAAREALLAKQQVQTVRDEKEKELRDLRSRLADLQSESSAAIAEREHSVILARAITANKHGAVNLQQARSRMDQGNAGGQVNRSKIDDIKQRFRDRSAAKQTHGGRQGSSVSNTVTPNRSQASGKEPQQHQRNSLYRTVGEEMFNHIDFYERSLKAVEK